MYNHEELLKYVIEELHPKHLQDIIEINKIKVNGFRKNSKNTKVKVLKMRNILKRNKDLEYLLNKCIKYYEDNLKIEYVWALPDQLDQEQVEKKINPENKGSVILELYAAKKFENIKEIMRKDKGETADEGDITINESRHPDSDSSNQKSVEKIRKLLIESEEKYKRMEERRNNELEEIKQWEKSFSNLKNEYSGLKKKIKEKDNEIIQVQTQNKALISRINDLESEVEKIDLDKESLKKYKVAIIGGDSYIKHVSYLLNSISGLACHYFGEKELQYLRNNEYFDAVWVVRFSLNRKEYLEVLDTNVCKNHMGVGQFITFDNTNMFNKFIDKVRGFYELR